MFSGAMVVLKQVGRGGDTYRRKLVSVCLTCIQLLRVYARVCGAESRFKDKYNDKRPGRSAKTTLRWQQLYQRFIIIKCK